MKNRLTKRLDRIEHLIMPADNDTGRVFIRFAHVRMLAPSYVGEKHEVLVTG